MPSFTTPVNPSDGQLINGDGSSGSFDWGAQIRDNLLNLRNGTGFLAQGSTLSIAGTGVFTKLPINSEIWDPFGWYDPTTNYRFTPLVAGYYMVSLAAYGATLNGSSGVSIHKNGAFNNIGAYGSPTAQDWAFSGCGVVHFNGTTDYVEAYAFHNTGANRNWNVHFSAVRIGG